MDAFQREKVGNCVGFQMLAQFKGTVWSGHKGTVWNHQGLALDSMLTSLQITLINDNSEWKRPFVRAMSVGRTLLDAHQCSM